MSKTGAEIATAANGMDWSLRDLAVEGFYNQRIIGAFMAAGLAAGLIAAAFAGVTYTADSLLLIRAGASEVAPQGLAGPTPALAGDAVQRIIQSDIQILRSDPVVRAALTAKGVPPTQTQVERFQRALHVTAEVNSNLIRVAFKSRDRSLAIHAVQRLIDAYAAQRARLYVAGPSPLQEAQIAHYRKEIADIETQIRDVRARYGVVDIAQDIQLATARRDALEQRAGQTREKIAAAKAERFAAGRQLAATPAQVFDSRDTTNATPNDDATNTLLRLRQEREHVAAQYAADWPGLLELDRKIAGAEAQAAANARDSRHSDRTVRNPVADILASRSASLTLEQAALARQAGELDTEQQAAADRLMTLRTADAALHDLERARAVAEGIERQLSVSQASTRLQDAGVDDANAALRIVQPPGAPAKGSSLALPYLLTGVLAGAAAAVATACARSVLREVFIAPRQAERSLALPALAEFDLNASDFSSVPGRAAVGRLATLISDTRIEGRPLQIVQLVGAEPKAKAALALALGQALAESSPDRAQTLIVDFDGAGWYRRIAPAAARRSLSLGSDKAVLGIARAACPRLWIATDIAATPLGDPRAALDTLRQWTGLLRQSFGTILLIAPEAFSDYPARRLYPLADANILLIDAETTRALTARRMRESVLAAGGDLLGFVFTSRRYFIPKAVFRWF